MKLQLAYYIGIALTGLVGNTTTIIALSQKRLRSLRSSFFLICLAITDLVFILILIIALLDELQVPVMTTYVCILTIYFSHIASFLSSNFTLAYTTHRLIAVFFPIKATIFLKRRTSRALACVSLLFACIFYSISFSVTTTRFRSNTTNIVYCEEDSNTQILFPFLILDTLFTFIIPFSCISCMNLAIVYKLHTKLVYRKKFSKLNTSISVLRSSTKLSKDSTESPFDKSIVLSQLTINNVNTNANTNHSVQNNLITKNNYLLQEQNPPLPSIRPIKQEKRKKRDRFIVFNFSSTHSISSHPKNRPIYVRSTQCRSTAPTKATGMLLAASTVFLIFNLPYHLLLFCFLFIREQPSWMLKAVNIARFWFFASFCVNFFVYVICGQCFRQEVIHLFRFAFCQRYFTKNDQTKIDERGRSSNILHSRL